ncbi:butyrophilin-like protein 2 [Macrotis lagotis]|uniref:butyrophilin-like protein 2 n=1 Tax=Macrotis lagotis TaxID=92651 RepID=UPI003D696AAC
MWTKNWNSWPASYSVFSQPLCLICLILVIFCILSSGTFTVYGPLDQPIQAWVGDDIHLSCHISPKMDASEMIVKWIRGPEVVHLYRRGQEVEDVQAPAFQGKTKMQRQDMAEGKVTVSIYQVQLSDAGQYTCYFQAGPFFSEASFDLQVAEQPFSVTGPAQSIQANQREDITLSCEISSKVDAQNMSVKWFRNQTLVYQYLNGELSQSAEFQGRMELLKHDLALGKLTLRIQQVQVSDSGPYTCQVQSYNYYHESYIELQVVETFFTTQKTLTIVIAGGVSVFFIGLVFSILHRERGKRRTFRSSVFLQNMRQVCRRSMRKV